MNLKEKIFKTIDLCSDPEGNDCQECPYYNKEWENCDEADLADEIMTLIKPMILLGASLRVHLKNSSRIMMAM